MGHAKGKFSTDRGVVLLKFFSQKIALKASERIKKRIVVHWLEFQALKSLKSQDYFRSDTIACFHHMFLRSYRIVFSLKIFACFRFR